MNRKKREKNTDCMAKEVDVVGEKCQCFDSLAVLETILYLSSCLALHLCLCLSNNTQIHKQQSP